MGYVMQQTTSGNCWQSIRKYVNEPELTDAKLVIAEIVARGKSLYYIALQMHRQYTQIKRMAISGRCQPYELSMLRLILEDVSRETLRNVTISNTQT